MIVATVYCGRCSGEGRSEPGKLGTVELNDHGDAVWNGWVSATVWPKPINRATARALREPRILATFAAADLPLPARLPVFCRVHGHGSVATIRVAIATGKVFLDIVPLS